MAEYHGGICHDWFNHSHVEGLLCSFQFGAVMNKAVHVFCEHTSSFLYAEELG